MTRASFTRTRLRRTAVAAGAFIALTTAVGATQASAHSAAQKQSGSRVTAAPSDCPKYYFCGYKDANFKRLAFKFKDCYMQEIPDGLNSGGSWYNNQSAGTKAKMFNERKQLIFTTPGAPSSDPSGNWHPVWYVDAC
ncbi:hypothetical protein [Streptomyces kanamyceticus]|uniref:Peptidase inhibitor n=1 Tax=Streptomyces kanamyceticus TaxID=1967 RepID=E9KTD0_STRKN|nr:hypothetical protein [Streptomyces kanamyceticus]ADU56281.1 hypothetical protein Tcs_SK_046 [Streptomyces kanamyceticus]QEU89912.1 hypothetical protein CP970_02380 [Streptomyces kanamyceticus]